MRVAFGTFIQMPEPEKFGEGADSVRTRWVADPNAAFAAEVYGKLVGSNFVTRWGSFGFFGPLTVHPAFWDQGVGKRLLDPAMDLFSEWRVRHIALYTFPNSPKHLGLYQRFGFWPRYLTAIMSKTVEAGGGSGNWSRFSDVADTKEEHLAKCESLAASIYAGLDLGREILAVENQKLGDTVMLWEGGTLTGFAVCHCGPGTEAGDDTCYVKFGTTGNGLKAGRSFDELLIVCEEYARMRGVANVLAGVNTACHSAYQRMLAKGYRTESLGVMMLRPNEPAFDNLDSYVICDLR
jgi:GNAT superfamily N-acetyltransferase